jgi:hypothetical protein
MKALLLALLLAGCTQKQDKPTGWDFNQETEIIQLRERVDTLERENRGRQQTENILTNEIERR